MKSYLTKLALLAFFCIAAPVTAQSQPTAEELSTVIHEILEVPLNDDETTVNLSISEYTIADGHIADIGMFCKIVSPVLNLEGNFHARNSELGKSKAFEGKNPQTSVIANFSFYASSKLSESETNMKSISMDEWNIVLQKIEEMKKQQPGVFGEGKGTLEIQILEKNKEGEITSFSMTIVLPQQADDPSIEILLTFNLKGDHLEITFEGINKAPSFQVFQDNEESAIQFFKNLRDGEPASKKAVQSAVHLMKAYLVALSSMVEMGLGTAPVS